MSPKCRKKKANSTSIYNPNPKGGNPLFFKTSGRIFANDERQELAMHKAILALPDHISLSLDSAEIWLHRVEWVMWAVVVGCLVR
jgi:hypothetical protein